MRHFRVWLVIAAFLRGRGRRGQAGGSWPRREKGAGSVGARPRRRSTPAAATRTRRAPCFCGRKGKCACPLRGRRAARRSAPRRCRKRSPPRPRRRRRPSTSPRASRGRRAFIPFDPCSRTARRTFALELVHAVASAIPFPAAQHALRRRDRQRHLAAILRRRRSGSEQIGGEHDRVHRGRCAAPRRRRSGRPASPARAARPTPTRRASRCVPPKPGMTPRFTSGCPNFAFSDA